MITKLKSLIIDDEPVAQDIIEGYISEIKWLELADKCQNVLEAAEILRSAQIDLMFLDIEMPMMNGLVFLRNVRNPPKAIITTAYREFALEGFELDVIDYLLKPISFERFLKAINKFRDISMLERTNSPVVADSHRTIYLKNGSENIRAEIQDIEYLQKAGNYIYYCTANRKILVRESVKQALKALGSEFIQIHKSYAVNLRKIDSFNSKFVQVGGQELPIGQSYKLAFIDRIQE